MQRIKLTIIFLLIIIILPLFLCGCNKKEDNIRVQNKIITLSLEQEKNAKITTDFAKNMELDMTITIPAQFRAQNTLVDKIYAPLNGKIEKIFVEPGIVVKKGQEIALIKTDEIGAIQLEFLEKILDIEGSIKEMTAQYNLSKQEYEREHTLYNEKISSLADYQKARAQMEKDKAALTSLQNKKSALVNVYRQRLAVYGGGSIDTVLKTRKISPYVSLKASKGGIVLERNINENEFIEKDKELFNIADLSTIWLVGYAFEKDASKLTKGEKVTGKLEEGGNKNTLFDKIEGTLSYVSPILDNTTKTLEVRADIENKDFKIKHNMYAEMFVDIGQKETLVIPNDSIEQYGDFSFAYVKIKPNTYEERKLEIGHKNDKYTEILSGIKEGEEVVVEGAFSPLGESIKNSEK